GVLGRGGGLQAFALCVIHRGVIVGDDFLRPNPGLFHTNLYLKNRETRIRAKKFCKYRPFASFAPFAVKIGFQSDS
ncbi:MAG: hypothetical protein LBM17_07690, partial [Candidatus Accumulibacter sp.]|nr:hypothetical protein [Accumulibacter sp.]